LKILITAGPTFEAIDPVRFIGNRSSGKMGYAIAKAFLQKGHEVQLVSGPVNIFLQHHNLELVKVESAAEMYEAVMLRKNYDIAVMAAAVADFTPERMADEKIKKEVGQNQMNLKLVKTKDILASLGQIKMDNQFLVGFALETQNEEANARKKLESKKVDAIVLNSMKDAGAGFGYDTNKTTVFFKTGAKKEFPLMTKDELAFYLVELFTSNC